MHFAAIKNDLDKKHLNFCVNLIARSATPILCGKIESNEILVGVLEFQTPLILAHWRRLSTVRSPGLILAAFTNIIPVVSA